MPAAADPDLALRLAKATADLYADAVAHLLRIVTRRLEQGIDAPGWAERKLLQLAQLRQQAHAEIARLERQAATAIRDAITHGHAVGTATAGADLRDAGATFGFGQTSTAAVDALVAETITRLQGTHLQILRHIDDAYRQVIAEASSGQVLTGTLTRRQAAQRALDRFADQGITGFIDRAGRRWALESYAEMATRTSVGRAQVQGTLDRYQANGKDLVIVSDAPEECPACRPWEGRVLSISGRTPTGTRTGGMEVAGSVAQAVSAGLQHANCGHRLGLFVPGLSRPMHGTADPDGYRERQTQRRLERNVRRWKRREAVAVEDQARRDARRRRAAAQSRLRAFVAEHDRKRLRARERIGGAI